VHEPKIRAVLLDLDDTLTDRPATIRAYAQQFVRDFGASFRVAEASIVAAELARLDRNGYNPDRASDLAGHGAWIKRPSIAELGEHWDEYFVVCTRGREGASATVDALVRAGIPLGVVTNGRTKKQRRKIEVLCLQDRLGALLISEECGFAKPDERIFRAAAAKLAVHPSECMFIGDNPEKDVRGAAAVGMRAVWFRAALPWPEGVAPPDECVTSFCEVLELPGLHLAHS
jgi:putative hydrolase of the HAD superfamily